MRAATDSPAAPPRLEGAGLPRRVRTPRAIGVVFGAVCVATALAQHGGPAWLWAVMAFHVFAWPHVAYALSARSTAPREAEYRNLVADCALTAFWLPAIGFDVLPSAVALTMVTMDVVAVGGPALMLRGVLAEVAGVAAGALLVDVRFAPQSSLATMVACLPVMIVYPLTVGYVMHRLSASLARRRREMAAAEQLYRDTLDAMEAGVVLYDARDRLVLCNDSFRALHRGIDALLTPGRTLAEVLQGAAARGLVPEASGRENAWVAEQLARGGRPEPQQRAGPEGGWRRIVDRRLPDGSLLSFSTDVTDLVQREQQLRRLNAERDDYAKQLRAVNERLELLSQTDALTGVANQRLFDQRLQEEWQRARRHGWEVALVMLDVDHFKRFNDRHGHLEGDACLRRVAQALQGCARRASDLVARYGGEEFVLLLPHTDVDDAALVAARCIAAVDAAAIAHGDSPTAARVTVSVGVAAMALHRASSGDVAVLVGAADRALYRAKANGRHRLERDDPQVEAAAP